MRIGIDARTLAEAAPMGVSRFMSALLQATAELAPQHDYLLYFRKEILQQPPFITAPFVPPGSYILPDAAACPPTGDRTGDA